MKELISWGIGIGIVIPIMRLSGESWGLIGIVIGLVSGVWLGIFANRKRILDTFRAKAE